MPEDRKGLAASLLALAKRKAAAASPEERPTLTREEHARLGAFAPEAYGDWAVADMRAARRREPTLDEARAMVAQADAADRAKAERRERLAKPATAADVLTPQHLDELVQAGHMSPESAAELRAARDDDGDAGPPVHPWPEQGLNEYARRMVSDPEGARKDLRALGVSDEGIARAKARGERLAAADELAAARAERDMDAAGQEEMARAEAQKALARSMLAKTTEEREALAERSRAVATETTKDLEAARLARIRGEPGRKAIKEALRRARPITRASMESDDEAPVIPTVPLRMPGIAPSDPLYQDPDAPRIRGAALFPGEATMAERLRPRKTGGLSEYDIGRLNNILDYQRAAKSRLRLL